MTEWLLGMAFAVVSIMGALFLSKRAGRKEAYDEMQDQDRAEAEAIRRRQRERDADGVQPTDIRYRD